MLRERILQLAMKRGAEKSICPSEVARSLFKDWREHMDDCRHQTIYHVNLFTKNNCKEVQIHLYFAFNPISTA